MIKYNAKNERIKREYFEYQKEAKGKSVSTIDNFRKSLDRYEQFRKYADFKIFNKKTAIAFKKHMSSTKAKRTGMLLSKASLYTTLNHMRDFYLWLSEQKGFRTIDQTQMDYFNLSEKEAREGRGKNLKKYPTLEQVEAVLDAMPTATEINRRDRALVALTILTGMRDGAIASLKLKHINLDKELVEQKPSDGVKTKFSKTIYTNFLPVGDDIKQIVVDWISYLRNEKLFNDTAPVFPATKVKHSSDFETQADGLEPIHWKSASPIRTIFEKAFTSAGLDYRTPHTFRTTLTLLGMNICRSPEEFKAWSQSLGHSSPTITLTSYGQIDENRQGEIIRNMSVRKSEVSKDQMIEEMYNDFRKKNKKPRKSKGKTKKRR